MEHTTTPATKSHVGRPSHLMISEMITEYEASQFSIEEYCEYKGLNQDTFQGWLSKHKNKAQEPPLFVPVHIKEEQISESLFAEYKGLKFYQPRDAEFFKALIS